MLFVSVVVMVQVDYCLSSLCTCPVWQVKVYCHEGEGEGNEHLDSMDLLDVKSELERDAEKSEVSTYTV